MHCAAERRRGRPALAEKERAGCAGRAPCRSRPNARIPLTSIESYLLRRTKALDGAAEAVLKAGDETEAVSLMPWRVIMMVCGMTVLISVLEETGGLALFTRLLADISTPNSVTAVMAFTTGFISIYSSTSGVVLPAFLPTVPDRAQQLGGVEPLAIASAMNIGAHMGDVSALSTLGALCIAAAPKHEDSRALFNKLMAWGLSMAVVGSVMCWLLFSVFRVGLG